MPTPSAWRSCIGRLERAVDNQTGNLCESNQSRARRRFIVRRACSETPPSTGFRCDRRDVPRPSVPVRARVVLLTCGLLATGASPCVRDESWRIPSINGSTRRTFARATRAKRSPAAHVVLARSGAASSSCRPKSLSAAHITAGLPTSCRNRNGCTSSVNPAQRRPGFASKQLAMNHARSTARAELHSCTCSAAASKTR